MSKTSIVLSFVILFYPCAIFGVKIYYPGTFDPFHKTHQNEVRGARKLFTDASIEILPIEQAYYRALKDGSQQPQLFPYELRRALIAKAFSQDEKILVSDRLRYILPSSNVFEVLKALSKDSQDPDKYLLIGIDVLKTWEKLPLFDDLLQDFMLIVSEDINDQYTDKLMKEKFQNNNRIIFNVFDSVGIRSKDINISIFTNTPYYQTTLIEEFNTYIHENPKSLERFISNFTDACMRSAEAIIASETIFARSIQKRSFSLGRLLITFALRHERGGANNEHKQMVLPAMNKEERRIYEQFYAEKNPFKYCMAEQFLVALDRANNLSND